MKTLAIIGSSQCMSVSDLNLWQLGLEENKWIGLEENSAV